MTCIVGLVEGGKVYMGADSGAVSGLDMSIRRDRKLFRVGNMLIGFTTSFRMGQLLGYGFTSPRRHPDTDMMEWMATDFVDAVRARLKTGGFAEISNNREEGGQFMVGVDGRLFTVLGDYQVAENDCSYAACGCGTPYALGAFANTDGIPPRDRLTAALLTAAKFSAGVCAPFVFEEV